MSKWIIKSFNLRYVRYSCFSLDYFHPRDSMAEFFIPKWDKFGFNILHLAIVLQSWFLWGLISDIWTMFRFVKDLKQERDRERERKSQVVDQPWEIFYRMCFITRVGIQNIKSKDQFYRNTVCDTSLLCEAVNIFLVL